MARADTWEKTQIVSRDEQLGNNTYNTLAHADQTEIFPQDEQWDDTYNVLGDTGQQEKTQNEIGNQPINDTYNTLNHADSRDQAQIDAWNEQLNDAWDEQLDDMYVIPNPRQAVSDQRPGDNEAIYGNLESVSLDPSE